MTKPKVLNYNILYYFSVLNYFGKKYNYNKDPLCIEANHTYQLFDCMDYINEPDEYDDDLVEFDKLIKENYGEDTILFLCSY